MKSIWEYYSTWFHFDTTTELYSVPASQMHAAFAGLAGVDDLTRAAETHIPRTSPSKRIIYSNWPSPDDPQYRAALEARRKALEILLARADAGFPNSYEMDWLKYRIRNTDEALAAAH